jgi:hypothetical protein
MVTFKQVVLLGVVVVIAAACSGDDETTDPALTSSTTAAPITTLADDGAATVTAAAVTTTTTSTTTTEAPELSFPEYRIISREATESGDVVVVLLDPTTYESLSDIDIHNVMSDLVEQFAPVYEAHIVETQAAADALFVEDPTPEQQTILDNNYIARLEEGFRIVYVGRFEEMGVAILGS